jgi:hypothetical protein
MTDELNPRELQERLRLIESMIAEGRRSTERWAWSFVLWGVAYYVAIAWSNWGNPSLAWPVTMVAAGALMGVIAGRIRRNRPGNTTSRAIGSVWMAMGISLFVVLMALSISGRYDLHVSVAIVSTMLGVANMTSALILRWKMQLACAVVWLATAIGACFANESQTGIVFLAAIFFCQIVFGIYGMIRESHRRKLGAIHV